MKCIIIGLGNFGSALSLKLMEEGHEVIGIDSNPAHVNQLQEKLTHTLVMDSTDELAIAELPLSDTDVVVIGIGEDVGSSITATALIKKYGKDTKIIGRAISKVHQTILQAMGVTEIINPEADFAHQFANKLSVSGSVKTFVVDKDYEIAEIRVPEAFIGKSVNELKIVENWKVSLVTILNETQVKNMLGNQVKERKVSGVVSGATVFKPNDTMVLFGAFKSIRKMMDEFEIK